MNPEEVCRAAAVSCDSASGIYTVTSFGMQFSVSVKDKTISSTAPGSEVLLKKLGYFFRLSVLWYLVNAKDVACTGTLVKLQSIKGGEIFTKGSHVLPLDPVAAKYGRNKEAFIAKGKQLSGEFEKIGDAALRLHPLPRIPVIVTLWLEDEEFPARADLLLDSTCTLQVPMDIVWSIAMMTLLLL